MRGRARTVMLIAILALIAAPAMAEKGDSKVRFGFQWVSPTGDYSESGGGATLTIEADDAIGGFVGYEYLLSDLVGIEAGLGFQSHDITITFKDSGGHSESRNLGDIFATPLLIGVNFHLLRSEKIDFYLGLDAGYVTLSSLSLEGQDDDVSIKNTTAVGAVAGIDVPFGQGKWMFSGALQYLSYGAEVDDENVTIDIDPLVVKVGVGVKF